jgi:hypothetical protein
MPSNDKYCPSKLDCTIGPDTTFTEYGAGLCTTIEYESLIDIATVEKLSPPFLTAAERLRRLAKLLSEPSSAPAFSEVSKHPQSIRARHPLRLIQRLR